MFLIIFFYNLENSKYFLSKNCKYFLSKVLSFVVLKVYYRHEELFDAAVFYSREI